MMRVRTSLLLSDMLPNQHDIAKAMGFVIVGGNVFGLLAPTVTGYVISLTGSYNGAFAIAGVLLLTVIVITLTMTHQPIVAAARVEASPARG